MTGYAPAEQDIRAALGLPYATGRDDPEPWHALQRAELEARTAA